jgi:NSS family neurotransmitter:Na+ symporter
LSERSALSIGVRSALGVWNFRSTFILAMIASAIGLGNLWRFSYLAAEHGGAPFVLSYLLALLLVAVPVLVAEIVIGSHGRSSPIISMNWAVERAEANPAWRLLGWMATLTAVLILSYYAVVAGWSLAYFGKMQSGMFAGASAAQVAAEFTTFLSDPVEMVFWQSLFLGAVMFIVTLGVRVGLGMLFWLLFPCLVALLLVLIDFSLEHGDVEAAQSFLFGYDPWHFSAYSVLAALGHAFFTLSVGVGAGMMFGAYAPERIPIVRTVTAVALLDTIFALAAGLAIFPIVFGSNMQPAVGPGLMFISLPYAFGNMHEGEFFGSLFFVLVGLATLGTAVCLAEVGVSYLVQRFKLRRLYAVLLLTPLIWVLGVGSILSFNHWSDGIAGSGMTFFQLIERLSADILLPLTALLIAIFVGWVMRREVIRVELYREDEQIFTFWRWSLRWLVPTAILAILVATIIGIL